MELSACEQAPLFLGKFLESWKCGWSRHYCSIPLIRGFLQYAVYFDTAIYPLYGGFCSMSPIEALRPCGFGNRAICRRLRLPTYPSAEGTAPNSRRIAAARSCGTDFDEIPPISASSPHAHLFRFGPNSVDK